MQITEYVYFDIIFNIFILFVRILLVLGSKVINRTFLISYCAHTLKGM